MPRVGCSAKEMWRESATGKRAVQTTQHAVSKATTPSPALQVDTTVRANLESYREITLFAYFH
jgi:hypothetical protein